MDVIIMTWTYFSLFLLIVPSYYVSVWGNNNDNNEIKKQEFLTPTITSFVVTSDIKYRYATTKFTTSYINPHSVPVTAAFYVTLPNRAYISNFTMNVNGNISVGKVREKEEAKCIYEATVSKGESAGIVKHRFTNVFDIYVNIEPYATAVFGLIYQELLQRTLGKYAHVIHLTNDKVISDFLVQVFIQEPQDIIDLNIPHIQSDLLKIETENHTESLKTASVEYISNKEVYIKYKPTPEEQKKFNQSGITGLFKVLYDVDRGTNPNMVYAIDGYFVHFFAPDSYENMAKNIVFMIDISGSMSGRKLQQVKHAMISILNSLNTEDDSFFLGAFSDHILWMNGGKEPQRASKKNILNAISYVQELKVDGSTNIYDALIQSVYKLNSLRSEEKKNLIFFLTDGQPTSGKTSKTEIRKDVRDSNEDSSLITLGFGENCDFDFLKTLASENRGFSRKIYFAADSQLQIAHLYKEISNILIKDIQITYVDPGINTQQLTATYFDSYYKGSELVVSGPLSKDVVSEMKIVLQITTRSGHQNQTVKLLLDNIDFESADMHHDPKLTSLQSLKTITRNTWVYLTLKKLMVREITLPKIKKRIIALGVKYGFVTPLTSMVVTSTNAGQCKKLTGIQNKEYFHPGFLYDDDQYYTNGFQTFSHEFFWVFLSMAFLLTMD